MDRRTEGHHSRGRRAFGLRGRAWPLSCRGLQSVFDRTRWRGVAVRADRTGHRRYAARPAIAADAADLERRNSQRRRPMKIPTCRPTSITEYERRGGFLNRSGGRASDPGGAEFARCEAVHIRIPRFALFGVHPFEEGFNWLVPTRQCDNLF